MIVLINPPSPFLIDDKVHPPLGVLYVATYAREHGVDCHVVDLAGVNQEAHRSTLQDGIPGDVELVGISATTPQFSSAKSILQIIREELPGVPVVIGGPHATIDPKSCYQFDYTVRGEGERPMVRRKVWGIDIGAAPYVHYTGIEDIDSIPYPDRNLIDITSYHYYINDEPATTLITSRGCPWGLCKFCSTRSIWGAVVRTHSPEYIHGEIKYLKSLGYRAFMFFDDVFVYPKKRFLATAKLLAMENIIYRCFVRSDVSKQVLEVLRSTGCVEIGFGAESGSDKILQGVCKNTSVAANTRLVETARKVGLRTKAFLMVGLPGESPETVQATYDWIKNIHPDDFDISVYKPYRGTPIANNPKAFDIQITRENYEDSWYKGVLGCYTSSVRTSGLTSDEIVMWRDKIASELSYTRHGYKGEAR